MSIAQVTPNSYLEGGCTVHGDVLLYPYFSLHMKQLEENQSVLLFCNSQIESETEKKLRDLERFSRVIFVSESYNSYHNIVAMIENGVFKENCFDEKHVKSIITSMGFVVIDAFYNLVENLTRETKYLDLCCDDNVEIHAYALVAESRDAFYNDSAKYEKHVEYLIQANKANIANNLLEYGFGEGICSPNLYNMAGIIRVNNNEFKEAVPFFKEAYKISPENMDIAYNLSYALIANNEKRTAAHIINKSLSEYPLNESLSVRFHELLGATK